MKKIYTLAEIKKIVEKARKEKMSIVATNGCFDILHVGHVRNFEEAKKLGDVLIVGINSDASVRNNKGPSRPIVPAKERAEIVASLKPVDFVFIFSGRTPFAWIRTLKPDIHIKGGGEDIKRHPDYPKHKDTVEKAGGKMVLLKHHDGRSTSALIKKILMSNK